MNLIIPLSLFIFTFKLGLAIPVNDDKLNPLVDDEYPMVIRNDRISGHSGMIMKRGRFTDDDEIKVTTTTATITTTSDENDEIKIVSTISPKLIVGLKVGQPQIVNNNDEIDNVEPNQYHLKVNDEIFTDQRQNHDENLVKGTTKSDSQSNDSKFVTLSKSPSPSTIIFSPSTIDQSTSKIVPPSTEASASPEIVKPTTTTTTTTTQPIQKSTTATQSFEDKVNTLIEESFSQTTKLLIDLEEQIKLSQFNQQIETIFPPLDIIKSTQQQLTQSGLPLAYGFKLSASNFLFRPIIRGSSIVSSAVNLHNTNNDLQSLTDSDNINLEPVNYETLDDSSNPNNPNSIINHNSHHWYGNQKQSGIQMQAMIDEVTRIEQNVEVLITELVSNRRYVTAAVFRSLLNYLRRLRISLERLQTRMAIIGVGNSPQGSGSSMGGSISSGISSSVSSIASSVSATFLPDQSSGPLGGTSGAFNPITSGSAIASSAIESIRIRMNRVTEEIRTLINRMRLSFSSPPASSSTTTSSSNDQSKPSTKSPSASSSPTSSNRRLVYHF